MNLHYRSVTCRQQDSKRFEKLGFEQICDPDATPQGFIVEMENEKNLALPMPTDIPYHGFDGLSLSLFACDGKKFVEAECNEERVLLLRLSNDASVEAGKEYERLLATVLEILG